MSIKSCASDNSKKRVVKLTEPVSINPEGEAATRVDIWAIQATEIKDMLVTFVADKVIEKHKIPSVIANKLESALDTAKKHSTAVGQVIRKLIVSDNAEKVVQSAIGLNMVLDTIEGEMNKAIKYNQILADIQNSDGIPYIPTHRLAATIGRQILYTHQLRVQQGDGDNSTDVEHMYFLAGASALNSLEAAGFITIHDANTGHKSIKDYLVDDENSIDYGNMLTEKVSVISLNGKALGAEKSGANASDHTLNQIRGEPGSARPIRDINSDFHGLKRALDAVHTLTVPQRIKLPYDEATKVASYHVDDYGTNGTTKAVKKALESKPLRFSGGMNGFFESLHDATKDLDISASDWIKSKVRLKTSIQQMFKLERGEFIESDAASASGRNLAATTPINDVIEYFKELPKDMYMAMFAGRNTRLYYDNSVVNAHSSKFMRYALSTDSYKVSTGKPAFNYFVDKMSDRLDHNKGASNEEIKTAILDGDSNTTSKLSKELNKALVKYKEFNDAESAVEKLNKAAGLFNHFGATNLAELVTTLEGIQDIRDALVSGNLESTVMVGTDATASGGQLTLMQAMGVNPKGIKKLLRQLGILKGTNPQETRDDVYSILKLEIEKFTRGEDPEFLGSAVDEDMLEANDFNGNARKVTQSISDLLFDGNLRELSKPATMTFIYGQREAGAINHLAQTFANLVIEKYKSGKAPDKKALRELLIEIGFEENGLTDMIKSNVEFTPKLVDAFKKSSVPKVMYELLQHSIMIPYLAEYKEQGGKVFKYVEKFNNHKVKVFPAPLVLDIALGKVKMEYTKANLEKYGVPLSKVMEIAKEVNGKETVLIRNDKLRPTVMDVSQIHSADTANLVYGLDGLIDSGVIVVHDEIRGNPELVMKSETQYIEANRLVGMHYDIHLEVMKSIETYNPELSNDLGFGKLKHTIEAQLETKKEILSNDYNSETTSVIGDKPINIDSNTPTQPTPTEKKVDTNKQPAKETKPAVETKTTGTKKSLNELAKDSVIISDFLKGKNRAKITRGEKSHFDPNEDTITISDKAGSNDQLVSQIEHEIVHSYTAALIQKFFSGSKDNNLSYVEKSIAKLYSIIDIKEADPSPELRRIIYALSHVDDASVMAEFISIMASEPRVAAKVYKLVGKEGTFKNVIDNIIARVRKIIASITDSDLTGDDVDVEKLYSAINSVIVDGKSMREKEFDVFQQLQKDFGKTLGFNTKFEPSKEGRTPTGVMDNVSYSIDNINASIAKYTVQVAKRQGLKLGSKADTYLRKFPMYRLIVQRAKGIYDDSTTLQQVMHKITNGNINQIKKNEILSLFQKISGDKDVITSKELERFKEASKGVSAVDLKAFEDFGSKMSMTDLFVHYATGIDDIDAEIAKIDLSATQVRSVDALVDFNVNDNFTKNTPYNLHAAGLGGKGIIEEAQKLLLLKSIKAIGTTRFKSMMKNTDLMDVARDNLLSNANIVVKNNSLIDVTQLRDSGLVDQYKEPITFKAISLEEMKFYDNNPDWKILRVATKNGPGIATQKIIDTTFQASVFTSIQMNAGDVEANAGRFKNKEGVISIDGKQKLVLTRKEKLASGLITNPAQSIVRTMTHNLAIQDSNVIREALIKEDTRFDIAKDGEELLVKKIKAPDEENPWFINDIEDRDFATLNSTIKAKYIRIPGSVSDVDGFDKKVKYVRKDISYWLVGSSEKSLSNNRTVQVAIRTVKHLMTGTKIGMVILNPVKIALDNVFNVVFLGALGVGPVDTAKSYAKISAEFHDYMRLKDKSQSLRVRAYADKAGKHSKEIERLKKQLAAHPINGVVERGFINSRGSEIIMQEDSPGSGFKTDIDKALKFVLQHKGQNNALGKLIMKVAKTPGLSMEGLLEIWSKPFKHFGSTKTMESELTKMSERVAHVKSDEDVIAYMHQYLNSPDSEFVKLGTHMTDLTDILAKETYYRHLVNTIHMDSKKAEIEVLKVFPDYKEGLPTAIQKMDSVGIVMFPQYWLQMIRSMYRLTEKRPASFGSEMLLAQMMGTQSQLWSQTIFDKAFSNWGLVHNPANHIGYGSIIPTNIF